MSLEWPRSLALSIASHVVFKAATASPVSVCPGCLPIDCDKSLLPKLNVLIQREPQLPNHPQSTDFVY